MRKTPRWQIERMIAARVRVHNEQRDLINSRWVTDEEGIVHIQLPSGDEAFINADSVEDARKYVWNVHKARRSRTLYAKAHVPGVKPRKEIFLHNLVMKVVGGIDHKDRNGLNCVRSNLRPATKSQNASNRIHKTAARYRGVSKSSECEKWQAAIKDNYIGLYSTPEEAALAYNSAARKEFGEFAVLNDIQEEKSL